jgi:ABC-type transport system involved in multi-copper enzyme maturation permease subunit
MSAVAGAGATPGPGPVSSERAPRSIHPTGAGAPPPRSGLRGWLGRIGREPNAIWMREMRQSARLARTPWILFALVLSLSLFLSSIGGIAAASTASPAELGGALFQVFFSLAYLVVVLIGPAVAANSIASEREGRTWEAVLLTGMQPKEIARGKFLAAYTTMSLYIVALAPVGALSFLFGGVTPGEVVVAFAFLFLVAALAVAFGLAVSSLMASLRGAIVVTLMLAIAIGPMLYGFGGVTGSIVVHRVWPEVPEAMPIWLPIAYERAPFGLPYLLLLVALPTLLVAVPAWFLYEATIANLTGEADDRSTGLKRWYAVCAPLLAAACSLPSLFADDDEARATWCFAGMLTFTLYQFLCVMLFAYEPPGPSRRVIIHWDRARASSMRRFFGPGLFRTSTLVTILGLVGVAGIAAVDGSVLAALGAPGKGKYVEQVVAFTAYLAPFGVLVAGLVAWLRSRTASPWVARVVAGGILFLIAAAPWVVAAIAGVLAESRADDLLAIAAPSPFFVFVMIQMIDHASSDAPVIVAAGMSAAALWGFLGLVLLALAGRRCARLVREHDDTVKRAEEMLAAEERAAAAQAAREASGAEPAPGAPMGA